MKKPPFNLANKPFVILSHPKTGAGTLLKYLNQSPNIQCYGQLFERDTIKLAEKKVNRLKVTLESRDEEPLVFLKQLFKLTPKVHAGFVFTFPLKKHLLLRRWLMNSELINRVIVLRNPFDIYASRSAAGSIAQVPSLIKFDAEQFDKKIATIIAGQNRLKKIAEKHPDSTITITHDEISMIASVQRVADFLGASPLPDALKMSAEQVSSPRYSELFEDFSKVQSHVSAHHPDLVIDSDRI